MQYPIRSENKIEELRYRLDIIKAYEEKKEIEGDFARIIKNVLGYMKESFPKESQKNILSRAKDLLNKRIVF